MKIAQTSTKIWAIVPAAGSGSRFSKTALKQYQTIQEKTVLQHSVNALFSLPLAGCVLAINPADDFAQTQQFDETQKVHFCHGGKERVYSVLNALYYLRSMADENDYVLVHDAARPCVSQQSLVDLVNHVLKHDVSAILATPVRDTLKRVDSGETINKTVDRSQLWQAQTPQMARLGTLIFALEQALNAGFTVTDEASALELANLEVHVVQGRSDNIKVTYPEDLQFADLVIRARNNN